MFKSYYCGNFVVFAILNILIPKEVYSSVSTFRVYNEGRILERLDKAPIVSYSSSSTMSRRDGELEQHPIAPMDPYAVRNVPPKRKKRLRKRIVKKLKRRTTTEIPSVQMYDPIRNEEELSIINNYNQRDIEPYEKPRKRRRNKGSKRTNADLQRAESGNPIINASAPISAEFKDHHGSSIEFQLQLLHPLLNSDSVLSQAYPKLPQNKTVAISHELNEDIQVPPLSPDLKKRRRKHPLLNPDSVLSSVEQAIKVKQLDDRLHHGSRKKIKQSNITIVQPFVEPNLPTLYPPVKSQIYIDSKATIKTTAPTHSTIVTVTRSKPTIKLTSPTRTTRKPKTTSSKPTISTTTQIQPNVLRFEVKPTRILTTLRPSTTITSKQQTKTINDDHPQIIIIPPTGTDEKLIKPKVTTSTISPEQQVLNDLAALQAISTVSTPVHPPSQSTLFDIFSFFTTPAPVTNPPSTTTKLPVPITNPTVKKPSALIPQANEDNVDNLVELALLEGLLQGNNPQGAFGSGNRVPVQQNNAELSKPKPHPTSAPSLQSAINNMISILTNPFAQATTTRPSFLSNTNAPSIFSGSNFGSSSLFGNNGFSLGGSSSNRNPLFGNNLFSINQNPTVKPTQSELDILSQLLQIGQVNDRKKPSTSSRGPPAAIQPHPSETMQLLNVLLNQPTTTSRPSGPYWWLDMNAFLGGPSNSDSSGGIRPKIGQRDYFVKVK